MNYFTCLFWGQPCSCLTVVLGFIAKPFIIIYWWFSKPIAVSKVILKRRSLRRWWTFPLGSLLGHVEPDPMVPALLQVDLLQGPPLPVLVLLAHALLPGVPQEDVLELGVEAVVAVEDVNNMFGDWGQKALWFFLRKRKIIICQSVPSPLWIERPY